MNDILREQYFIDHSKPEIKADSLIYDRFRDKTDLGGPWHYAVDQYDACIRNHWYMEYTHDSAGRSLPVDFSFDTWPCMELPCSYNMADPELFHYEGPMIFTRTFDIDAGNDRVFLRIGAANYLGRVILNKHYLGVHKGGSTPFCVELTDYLEAHNRLILVADSSRRIEQVPTVETDWFNYGGVYRDIELIRVPRTFIHSFRISLLPDDTYSHIHVLAVLDGSDPAPEALLTIPELELKASIPVINGRAEAMITVNDLRLWSPDSPKLYELTFSCGQDCISDRVGFRQIRVKGHDIELNGQSIFLRGICLHEDSLSGGKHLTEAERIENLRIAKYELGCNFMRLAHYPHSENVSMIADSLGIMLWEEIPVYWGIRFEREETLLDASNQLTELISRDFNRASVIIWSVGNENPDTDERFRFMTSLAELAHRLDDTRMVSAACLVSFKENAIADRLAASLDIIGLNEYYGWYDPDFDRLTQLFDNSSPTKPVIITECGADAMPGLHGPADEKGNEEYQAGVYRRQIEVLSSIPYVKGMTPWIMTDFRCPRRTSSIQLYYNRKGLLSPDKQYRKLAFGILADFYHSFDKA